MQRSVMRDSTTMRELFIRSRQSRKLSFSKTTKWKDVHFEEKRSTIIISPSWTKYRYNSLDFDLEIKVFPFWCKILLKFFLIINLIEMMRHNDDAVFESFGFFFKDNHSIKSFSLGKAPRYEGRNCVPSRRRLITR